MGYGYSNSKLVSFTKISPNQSGQRNHRIDTITPHCYVGQVSVESMAGWLCNAGAKASANYGIGFDGKVGLFVEEKDRSWCSSSSANDNRAVTIECASDIKDPYAIKNTVYDTLIDLMVDICKRNGKKKLLWLEDKNRTLSYEPKDNEMLITVHRWFANKACPGDYIYNRLGEIARTVTAKLANEEEEVKEIKWYRVRKSWADASSQTGAYEFLTTAKMNCPPGYTVYDWNGDVVFAQLPTVAVLSNSVGVPQSKQDFINKVSNIAKKFYPDTKILPSVVIAQCCLETGYGLGADANELVKVNNLLGMKSELLNSTWKNYTVWDGKSISKLTPEVQNGKTKYITDSFRAYKDYENCIYDYEMFLLFVKSNGQYKYRKIMNLTNPEDVITAISNGGYATDPSYITKVMSIIKENDFTKYDKEVGVEDSVALTHPNISEPELSDNSELWFRVQIGAFDEKANAKKLAEQVKEKGFNAIVKDVDGMYKVQVGAYKLWENANKKLNEVKSAGFADAFIAK